MKKMFLISLLLFLLCGCRTITTENGRFLVSAIGVDTKEDTVLTTVEVIVINSEDSATTIQKMVFEDIAPDFNSAIKNIGFKTAKPLDFSHCAIIVLGDSVTKTLENDVYDFCSKNKEITVSVGFVKTPNAKELLSLKPKSEITIGYELAVMLETQYNENKIAFNNRFFEIENARINGRINTIPKFIIKDQSFYLEGEKNQR